MGIEYKIQFSVPENYDPTSLLQNMPFPVASKETLEIYNYSIEPDGFYFIDHLVDKQVSSHALRLLIDAALSASVSIRIIEL